MDVERLTSEERQRWEQLTPEERAFVLEREPLWRRAHEIAERHPGVDVSDVFHALSAWHETPTERLKRAFRRGRLIPRTG